MMGISPTQRVMLNQKADHIEEVLSSLKLPTKVHGGIIGRSWIRFHLTPISDVHAQQIREAANKVAEAMGVYRVQVSESEEGFVLDFPFKNGNELRLLPLLKQCGNLLPLTAVIGISSKGRPLLLNLRRSKTWHLFISGPMGSGKSELLRTLIFSLALKNQQSQVQFLGIDPSGKELTIIEALPHAFSEVASDPEFAEEILQWLLEEIGQRKRLQILKPDIILVVEDIERWLDRSISMLKDLEHIICEGEKAGVHLIFARKSVRPLSISSIRRRTGVVRATSREGEGRAGEGPLRKGEFEFQVGFKRTRVQVAWLPALDLQKAVTMIRTDGSVCSDADLP